MKIEINDTYKFDTSTEQNTRLKVVKSAPKTQIVLSDEVIGSTCRYIHIKIITPDGTAEAVVFARPLKAALLALE